MHWENKFSLFLKYLGNDRKIQIFQVHFQFISSTNHVQKKEEKDSYKSMHTFVLKGTLTQ